MEFDELSLDQLSSLEGGADNNSASGCGICNGSCSSGGCGLFNGKFTDNSQSVQH